jgi:hypothetical protein
VDRWPQIRGILRDLVAIGLGAYIGIRAGQPPITIDDLPAFTAAAGFIGVPFVVRAK